MIGAATFEIVSAGPVVDAGCTTFVTLRADHAQVPPLHEKPP